MAANPSVNIIGGHPSSKQRVHFSKRSTIDLHHNDNSKTNYPCEHGNSKHGMEYFIDTSGRCNSAKISSFNLLYIFKRVEYVASLYCTCADVIFVTQGAVKLSFIQSSNVVNECLVMHVSK